MPCLTASDNQIMHAHLLLLTVRHLPPEAASDLHSDFVTLMGIAREVVESVYKFVCGHMLVELSPSI